MNKFSSSTEERLNILIPLIENINTVGLTALDKFPTAEYSLLTFTFITYLERFVFNLKSITVLLRNFKEHFYVETSIGLTIRASLLDLMTLVYLSSYQIDIATAEDESKAEAEFDRQFNMIISDQIQNSLKYLKLAKGTGILDEQDYRVTIENLWAAYRFLFIDDIVDYTKPEKKLLSNEFKTPKQYFTRIHNHSKVKRYSEIYDLYTYYSKYDHFGIMTHLMQREGVNQSFERIVMSLDFIIKGIGIIFTFLSHSDGKLDGEMIDFRKLQAEFNLL